jgi:hypothetical protein
LGSLQLAKFVRLFLWLQQNFLAGFFLNLVYLYFGASAWRISKPDSIPFGLELLSQVAVGVFAVGQVAIGLFALGINVGIGSYSLNSLFTTFPESHIANNQKTKTSVTSNAPLI